MKRAFRPIISFCICTFAFISCEEDVNIFTNKQSVPVVYGFLNIKDTIQHHHSPSLSKRSVKHISVTHVADYLSTKNILSPVDTDPGYPLDAAALEVLGISEEDLNDIESRIVGYVNSDD